MNDTHDPKDFLGYFHAKAQEHGKKVQSQSLIDSNDAVKQKVVGMLQKIKSNQKELEQLKQTNPKAYESMLSLTQAMLSMAKEYMAPNKLEVPPLQKAGGRIEIHHPDGSTLQGIASDPKTANTGKVFQDESNIVDQIQGDATPKRHRRSVRASMVMNPQTGKVISSLEQAGVSNTSDVGFSPYVKEG